MKNFTDYYLQCLQIKNKENLKNFPVYNPITNGCDYFITVEKGNANESNLLLILVVDPVFSGYKNFVFNYENKIYKYHLIIYKNYDFDNLSDEIILSIQSQFDFLRNLDYNRINIKTKEKLFMRMNINILKYIQKKMLLVYLIKNKKDYNANIKLKMVKYLIKKL